MRFNGKTNVNKNEFAIIADLLASHFQLDCLSHSLARTLSKFVGFYFRLFAEYEISSVCHWLVGMLFCAKSSVIY